jgi:uncharacterized protein
MDYSMLLSPTLGLFVGLLMGLTGAGGGILFAPLLVFFLHLSIAEAALFVLSALIGLLVGRAFGKKLSGPRLEQIFAVLIFSVALA